MGSKLKVYVDRMSQPSRAILIFCKINGIDFDEVNIDLTKQEQRSPQYAEVNTMKKVPTIVHGPLTLFESHAILIYLASAFPGVADHWYPADLVRRARIHSVLDWHHTNLRQGSVNYVLNTVLAPFLGLQSDPEAAAKGEKLLSSSLSIIEDYWLSGDGQFLCNGVEPSIADLSLVCEIMQLELLKESDRNRIFSPYKKVLKWIEDTKTATNTHFEEIHATLYNTKEKIQQLQAQG